MELKGVKVCHKIWGTGVIEESFDEIISVCFRNVPEGEKKASFSILSSFKSGFLSVLDEESGEKIEQAIKDLECTVCKRIAAQAEVVDGKRFCIKCKEHYVKDCQNCGRRFFSPGYSHSTPCLLRCGGKWITICPDCMAQETFVCTRCGEKRLKSELVNSKYIPKSQSVCKYCVEICAKCGAGVDKEHIKEAFGKKYCDDCWDKAVLRCPICYSDFLPENSEQTLCPDCMNMKKYIARLRTIDFSTRPYKHISYYSLEYLNRCELFTLLYDGFDRASKDPALWDSDEKFFQFLLIDMYWYKVVVTYLPHEILGDTKCSDNVTMTQFRKKKIYQEVLTEIKGWTEDSTEFMETSAGKMKLMYYPVRLRVQTDYDKIYGKEWNGPGDYIEIGNYGDTTDFYMIGIIE